MRFRKWLIVTQYYHPEPGAPQIRLRHMAKQLAAHGCEVTILTGMPNYPEGIVQPAYKGKLTMQETIDGIPVKRIWLYPAGGKKPLKRMINYLTFTFNSLLNIRLARKFNMIFIEAQPLTLAWYGTWAKALYGKPYIYNTPDLQVEIAGERGWMGRTIVNIAKRMETRLMTKAFSVSTVTYAFIEHFIEERGIARNKMSFLPNGVDTDAIKPLPYDNAYAEKMGTVGKKVFTYAGTHADYQGLDVILDAAKLVKDNKEIVFLMAGKGPERQRLIDRAKEEGIDNVLFRDSPFDEAAQLFSISYAFVVVLRNIPAAAKMRLSKTFPPLGAGVPVIFGGIGESSDIIRNEKCGIATPPEDPKALAEAVLEMANNQAFRDECSRNGLALIERDFSWKGIVSKWLKEIEGIG